MTSGVAAEAEEELLALQSIYEDKLILEDVKNGVEIGITIHPATGDDVASQYVYLKILFTLPRSYPESPPEISFATSRGLSDHHLDNLLKRMHDFAKERTGECILFDLMEMAKDILTSNNIPSCPCSVCLMSFHECDDFLKTECYHYFHSYCLNQYVEHLISQGTDVETNFCRKTSTEYAAPCPVCRLSVTLQLLSLQNAQPPINDDTSVLDNGAMERHKKLHGDHYRKQLEKGGLIDLEQEKNKFLLSSIEQRYKTQKVQESESADREGKSTTKNDDVPRLPTASSKRDHCTNVDADNVTRQNGKISSRPPKNGPYNKGGRSDKRPSTPKSETPMNSAKTKSSNGGRTKALETKDRHPTQQGRKNPDSHNDERQPKPKNNYNRNKTRTRNNNRNWQNGRTANTNVVNRTETVPSRPDSKSPHCSGHKETQSPIQEKPFVKVAAYKKVNPPPGFPLKPPPGFENVKPAKQIPLP